MPFERAMPLRGFFNEALNEAAAKPVSMPFERAMPLRESALIIGITGQDGSCFNAL